MIVMIEGFGVHKEGLVTFSRGCGDAETDDLISKACLVDSCT